MSSIPSKQPLQDIEKLLPFLACPWDGSALSVSAQALRCAREHSFELNQGVPVLLDTSPGKSRERGTSLFEETSFYFERLHEKRVNEWRVLPFKAQDVQGPGWLLDVGSGAGTWAVANARRGMPSIGVEISKEGALFAAQLARRHGVQNCFFVAGDAVQLPFRSGAFNWVTNYTAIEHIYDPEKCIAEMARVLRPEGRLLINTINNFSLHFQKGREAWPSFLRHFKRYLGHLFSSSPREAPVFRDPSTVTYEAWSSGEDVDLYEAVSYELLSLYRRHLRPDHYLTFSYPEHGREFFFGEDLLPVSRSLSWGKKILYALLRFCNQVPGMRHMGKTITLIGRPLPR